MVKNLLVNAGDRGLIPGWEDSTCRGATTEDPMLESPYTATGEATTRSPGTATREQSLCITTKTQ